jgi:NitT/TauT family transport system substrate-binding protein/putative hydroxymethylpyrimidine transport system substrate-binding protein
VALRRAGLVTREFRVDDYGAPRYPELVLATTAENVENDPEQVHDVWTATRDGYEVLVKDPTTALDGLLHRVEGLDPEEQRAQMDALVDARAFTPVGEFDREELRRWARWDARHGIVEEPPDVDEAFVDVG